MHLSPELDDVRRRGDSSSASAQLVSGSRVSGSTNRSPSHAGTVAA